MSEPGQYVECLTWKVRATATLPKPELVPVAAPVAAAGLGATPALPAPLRRQPVVFAGSPEPLDTPVYAGSDLHPGAVVAGPAIVVEPTTTLVIDPGAVARVTALGSYLIDVGSDPADDRP